MPDHRTVAQLLKRSVTWLSCFVVCMQITGCVGSGTPSAEPTLPDVEVTAIVTMTPSTLPVTGTLTLTPDVLPIPTAEEATRRAVYEAQATSVAAGGQTTLEPYETIWARETAIYAERTQYYENQYTPTPFGPIPFPGTRLTDEELAERGWPRMLEDGQRNSDFRTSAIWLDKAYVDAEIFSQYQALFELLAFRDGPPGDDFEARLRELMLPSEPEGSGLDGLVAESYRDGDLASCTYSAVTESVLSLRDAGAYVRVPDDLLGFSMIWQYVEDQPAPIGAYTDKAITFSVNEYFIVFLRVVLQHPERPETLEGLNLNFQTVAVQTGEVMQEWVSTYNVTTANESFVAVWSPETGNWRLLKYESPYCSDYYPASIRK